MAKQNRGFKLMDPAKVREIASQGGRAAHEKGVAFEWTGGKDGTAAAAGRKGLVARQKGKTSREPHVDLRSAAEGIN